MRKILPVETIAANAEIFRAQIARFLDFSEGKALMLDNAEWLAPLNYIEFLRDIGKHFSVNRMLSFETYKMRMETGLSFIEFNYQILQSYDYLVLFRRHGCRLQMGGDDQWGNIVAGMDLIRRIEGVEAFALTSPLVTRSDGKKMGKSEKGALYLDPGHDQPLRVLPVLGERPGRGRASSSSCASRSCPCRRDQGAVRGEGPEDQRGQATPGMEITTLVHGPEAARTAADAARAAFEAAGGPGDLSGVPSDRDSARGARRRGSVIVDLFVRSTLCATKSDARRLVSQGGAYVGRKNVTDLDALVTEVDAESGAILLRAGKKRYFRIIVHLKE